MSENRNTPGTDGSTGNTTAPEPKRSISLVSLVVAIVFVLVCALVLVFAINARNGDDRKPAPIGTHQPATSTPTPSALNELSKSLAAREQLIKLNCSRTSTMAMTDEEALKVWKTVQQYRITSPSHQSALPMHDLLGTNKAGRPTARSIFLSLKAKDCTLGVKIVDSKPAQGNVAGEQVWEATQIVFDYPKNGSLVQQLYPSVRPDATCINYDVPVAQLLSGKTTQYYYIVVKCTNSYESALPESRERLKKLTHN